MDDWLRTYLAGVSIQPLLADIKTGKVRPSSILLAIQQLSKEQKQQMQPALDQIIETLEHVTTSQDQE